jgi:hypothetical protein
MKQTLSILLGVALAATAFGGDSLKELTLTLSTQGPDLYADGSAARPCGDRENVSGADRKGRRA